MCAAFDAELPSAPGPAAGSAAFVGFLRDLRDRLGSFDALDLPDELRTASTDVPAVTRQADDYLARAEAAAAAGDDAAAELRGSSNTWACSSTPLRSSRSPEPSAATSHVPPTRRSASQSSPPVRSPLDWAPSG